MFGKDCEFIQVDEMVPGREFEYMGYFCYWTGWNRFAAYISYLGQWVAIDPKTEHGYVYSLPVSHFGELNNLLNGANLSGFPLAKQMVQRLLTEKKFRQKMISTGKMKFKKLIYRAEHDRLMKSLEGKPETAWTIKWSDNNSNSTSSNTYTYYPLVSTIASSNILKP